MATPQLQQCFVSSCNPAGVGGDAGRAFQYTLMSPVGSGNCIVFVASYPHGVTASISDNNGNTWGSAAKSVDAGTGNYILSIWVLANANAGSTTFTLGIGATNKQPVSFAIYEYNNIATTTPVDVTAGATSQSGTSLATGSMTTTVDGDLIIAAYHPAGGIGANPTSWAAGSGFALMEADIAWNSNQGYPKATQTQVQSTHGAINSSITINGDATDAFNCVAVALKTASAGTAYSGMRVLKHIEQACQALVGTTWKCQFPMLGTHGFFGTTISNGNQPLNSITDSNSKTWSSVSSWSADSCQGYFLENATPDPTETLTFTWTAASTGTNVFGSFYDIAGAATSGQPGAVASHGLVTTSASSIANFPNVTPQSSAGSLIFYFFNNQGTGGGISAVTTAVTSPSGVVWAGVPFTGKTGGNQFDFGDGWAVLTNNTSTSTQNVTWSLGAITSNNVSAAVVEFLPAPASSQVPYQPYFQTMLAA